MFLVSKFAYKYQTWNGQNSSKFFFSLSINNFIIVVEILGVVGIQRKLRGKKIWQVSNYYYLVMFMLLI